MTEIATVRLRPAEGLTVRDPLTRQPLDPAGEPRALDTHWRRRLADGDVEIVPADEPETAAAPEAVPDANQPASGTAARRKAAKE